MSEADKNPYAPDGGNHPVVPMHHGHHDDKGRLTAHAMNDREILEELLENSRRVTDLVEGFFSDLKGGKINPMRMMTGMFTR